MNEMIRVKDTGTSGVRSKAKFFSKHSVDSLITARA